MANARILTVDELEPGEVEILRLGEHHGAEVDLTIDDLRTIVADYEPALRHQATAVIDHDPADREPDDPHRKGINHGLIERVRLVKDSVVARVNGVTDQLRELVNSRRLHAVTPEIYRSFRGTGRPYLRCVAFVGADTPAQKGLLPPILMSEHGEAATVRLTAPVLRLAEDVNEENPTMTAKPGETNPTPNPAPGGPTNPPAPSPNPTPSAPAPTPSSTPAPSSTPESPSKGTISLAEVTDAVNAAVKPLLEKVTTLEARLEANDPEYGDGAIVRFAEALVSEGRIEGKDKDRIIARAKALRGQTIKFGETTVSALADYMDQERGRPVLAQFGELNVPQPQRGQGPARPVNGTLKFAEGKAPKFAIHVPEGTDKETVERLTRMGEFAAENGIVSFAEASQRFEREVEGVRA